MSTLADLTDEVNRQFGGSEGSLPQPLIELENNIEVWITYLSQRQLWLTEYENGSNKSLARHIRDQIGTVIEEHTARVSQTEPPPWSNRLIGSWHREQTTIITFDYDTLVERASKQVQATEKVNQILAAQLYPPHFSDVEARSGFGLWDGDSLMTFSFLEPCLSALRIHPLGVACVRRMASESILHVVCVCINRIGTLGTSWLH